MELAAGNDRLKWPQFPKADLTVDDIDRLNESLNVDHNKQVLADIFRLDAWQKDLKQAIVMDMYYYSLQFARDNNFTTREDISKTPFGNLEHTFKFFKELLLCHAVNRPPHSIELFSADEVRKITEYVINTYFRHFKMYKYAFTPLVRLDLTINYLGVPVSPEPTEAGDADEETTQDADTVTVDDAGEPAPLEGEAAEEQSSDTEESEARKELRAMIQNYLTEEIKRVKVTVEEQLRTTEDTLAKKIDATEDKKKSPRKDSAKKKK
nr:hypothetical protein BaRGS_006599 [Batillaria attramentaria]